MAVPAPTVVPPRFATATLAAPLVSVASPTGHAQVSPGAATDAARVAVTAAAPAAAASEAPAAIQDNGASDAAATQGLPSLGSAGHPDKCQAPCKYFWKAKGCKDGLKCSRCHICQWSRSYGRGQLAALGDDSDGEGGERTLTAELEESLNANHALYGHLPDEELEKMLPRRADGSLASVGSMLHASERCFPCASFQASKSCSNGTRCKFCHTDHPKKKRARAQKRKADEANGNGALRNDGGGQSRRRFSNDLDGVRLDQRGNSRPCWLQDDDCDIYGPPREASGWGHPPHSGHAPQGHPAHGPPMHPPPASHHWGHHYGGYAAPPPGPGPSGAAHPAHGGYGPPPPAYPWYGAPPPAGHRGPPAVGY